MGHACREPNDVELTILVPTDYFSVPSQAFAGDSSKLLAMHGEPGGTSGSVVMVTGSFEAGKGCAPSSAQLSLEGTGFWSSYLVDGVQGVLVNFHVMAANARGRMVQELNDPAYGCPCGGVRAACEHRRMVVDWSRAIRGTHARTYARTSMRVRRHVRARGAVLQQPILSNDPRPRPRPCPPSFVCFRRAVAFKPGVGGGRGAQADHVPGRVLPRCRRRLRGRHASRAVQFHLDGGQSDFVWLTARTPHGGASYVW